MYLGPSNNISHGQMADFDFFGDYLFNPSDLDELKYKIKNQLEDDSNVPNELLKKDILYLPDFLINAGGIISVYHEQINQIDLQKVMQMTETIYDKAIDVFKYANENTITTHSAAMKIAVERIKRNKKKSN